MKEVILAKTAGFCFGVKLAVDKVYECLEKGEGPIYTYGPIIHNDQVVGELAEKGVRILDGESIQSAEKGRVIIRSHGITRKEEQSLKKAGFTVLDATCPFVRRIHELVETMSKKGYPILIFGSPNHAEVIGIKGWVTGECFICEEPEDLQKIPDHFWKKMCVVEQTTFNYKKFEKMLAKIRDRCYDVSCAKSIGQIDEGSEDHPVLVFETICNATQDRQSEAQLVAREVDCMLIIGDRQSSNSRKLFEICRELCPRTYFIQSAGDLLEGWFTGVSRVGITAGASTPKKIIEEVQEHVRNF